MILVCLLHVLMVSMCLDDNLGFKQQARMWEWNVPFHNVSWLPGSVQAGAAQPSGKPLIPCSPRRCPDSLKFCPREGGWRSVGRELEMYPTSLILKFSFSQQEPPESLLCTVYVRGGGIRAVLRQEGQWDNNSRNQELGSLVPASSLTCLGLRAKVPFHIPEAK